MESSPSWLRVRADHIPTGCESLDEMLKGGFPAGELSLVYGEAATGKTTLAMQTSIEAARYGWKTLYVDSDHSFTDRRFMQIAYIDAEEAGRSVFIFRPSSFLEQGATIEGLANYLTKTTRLIVVDTITSLYRASFGSSAGVFLLNRELSRQVAYLSELAMKHAVAVIVTSQVHTQLEQALGRVEPVARRVLFHMCKTILSLRSTARPGVKEAVLETYRGREVPLRCILQLTDRGFEPARL